MRKYTTVSLTILFTVSALTNAVNAQTKEERKGGFKTKLTSHEKRELYQTAKHLVSKHKGKCADFEDWQLIGEVSHWRFRDNPGLSGRAFEDLIEKLEEFPSIKRLDFENTNVCDKDIKTLSQSKLKDLVEINLDRTFVTDRALQIIAETWPKMENLGLNCTDITDKGVKDLEPLENLLYLYIGNTKITDKAMDTVANFTNLRDLNVAYTRVSGNGLQRLVEPPKKTQTKKRKDTSLIVSASHEEGLYPWPKEELRLTGDETTSNEEPVLNRGIKNLQRLWWVNSHIKPQELVLLQKKTLTRIKFMRNPDF